MDRDHSTNLKIAGSVPKHLVEKNPKLWSLTEQSIDWNNLGPETQVISGSAFINLEDPFGTMGNPFAIVIGQNVGEMDLENRRKLAQELGTPETVFINSHKQNGDNDFQINLTVFTPKQTELGACAHGFTGAIQTLLETGTITRGSIVAIETTLDTKARAYISNEGTIALEFQAQPAQQLEVSTQDLEAVFQSLKFSEDQQLWVLSVGSPKLMIELTDEAFMSLQADLSNVDFDTLAALQGKYKVNGVHIFTRNNQSMPAKCIQLNYLLDRENFIDRATGVSNAAQIAHDRNVQIGETLEVTQYNQDGPSAVLTVTKTGERTVRVGGTAVLFNKQAVS